MPPSQAKSTHYRHDFDGRDILSEIDSAGDNVGIVTLAPELEGALDLIRHLASSGTRVSLGHSGATLEQARAAIAAGARHATHLFNRMPPLSHRDPGLVGAILTSEEVAAEIICDGVHVHRDMVRMAIRAKGVSRMMAITDGVAAAGLSEGSTASLGSREIRVRNSAAYLEDGTLAGSVATMDRVFRFLVTEVGLSLNDAAQLCATTPASELGLKDTGVMTNGAIADLVVMDRDLNVKRTYVGGRLVYSRD
jgi:N-acetylglucosamine-6-phosphate deacetylase